MLPGHLREELGTMPVFLVRLCPSSQLAMLAQAFSRRGALANQSPACRWKTAGGVYLIAAVPTKKFLDRPPKSVKSCISTIANDKFDNNGARNEEKIKGDSEGDWRELGSSVFEHHRSRRRENSHHEAQ